MIAGQGVPQPAAAVLSAALLLLAHQAVHAQRPEWEPPGLLEGAPAFERELAVRSPRLSGPEVVMLQLRLIELGYTSLGAADGFFGPRTAAAFERFAGLNGVDWSGVVDEEAWTALFSQQRQPNRELPTLSGRTLVSASGIWGLVDRSSEAVRIGKSLDPDERIPGYLHCAGGEVHAVTARVQWYWDGGPYSPNDFAPSVRFAPRGANTRMRRCNPAVFSHDDRSPFVEQRQIQGTDELPAGLQVALTAWIAEQGIVAPLAVQSGVELPLGRLQGSYLLVLTHNAGWQNEPTEDSYSVIVTATRESDSWTVNMVTGALIDSERLQPSFRGFFYSLRSIADADGNGVVDFIVHYGGGAAGNGETMYLLGERGARIGSIPGFGN